MARREKIHKEFAVEENRKISIDLQDPKPFDEAAFDAAILWLHNHNGEWFHGQTKFSQLVIASDIMYVLPCYGFTHDIDGGDPGQSFTFQFPGVDFGHTQAIGILESEHFDNGVSRIITHPSNASDQGTCSKNASSVYFNNRFKELIGQTRTREIFQLLV